MVTVTGPGSTWTNSSNLRVGFSGIGTLLVEDGGSVTSAEGTIGAGDDAVGTVDVTGSGASWSVNQGLDIAGLSTSGNGGTGTLRIGPSGSVNVGTEIALFPDGNGEDANDE